MSWPGLSRPPRSIMLSAFPSGSPGQARRRRPSCNKPNSVGIDLALLNHLLPLVEFGSEDRGAIGSGRATWLDANLRERRLHLVLLQDCAQRCVERLYGAGRRPGGREDAEPEVNFKSLQ